jgi:hypothetical protein
VVWGWLVNPSQGASAAGFGITWRAVFASMVCKSHGRLYFPIELMRNFVLLF